jgi:hypothetical protein
LEHPVFEDIKSRFEQEVSMVMNAMVNIRLCEAPSDENIGCKILDLFVHNTHPDIAGELAGLLSIVLDSEEKNNFRTWRRYASITAQLSEVFTLSYFNQRFKLRRHLPVSLGAVTGSDGAVTHVGASSNFPPPEFRTRDYFEKERKRRNDYIVIEIDQKIQAGIKFNSKSTSPLDKLSEEECQQRNRLELQNWIVFRCSAEENSLHPNHWEPCCSKYFLYHLNKTD